MSSAQSWDIGSGPGVTALGLAYARTVESGMPDRLIDDPFARWFVDATETRLPMLTRWPEPGIEVTDQQKLHLHGSRYIGLRTRYYDDWLRDAAASGVRQLVLLGAGLDTRAYRLDWPAGIRFFEIDQPAVLAFKEKVLTERAASPTCELVPVAVDLRDDWAGALRRAGFDPSAATAWLAEGLLAYLPAQAEAELFGQIDALSAPGSRLALDRIVGDLAEDGAAQLRQLSKRSGMEMDQMISTEARTDVLAWLAEHRWSAREEDATASAERYGRDLADPFADSESEKAEQDERAVSARDEARPPWLATRFVTSRRNDH